MRLNNRLNDYIKVSSFGLAAGIIARLTDCLSMDSLWSFPTIATLFGFWIITVTIIIWRSTSHLTAGLNSFLYLFFTTVAFYGLQFILGLFLPKFDIGGFPTRVFLSYVIVSAICGIAGAILYFWNHKAWYSAILMAAPLGVLTSETISVLILLQRNQTHLFQVILNAGFAIYLGVQFRKQTKFKELYTVSIIMITALTYYYLYRPWL